MIELLAKLSTDKLRQARNNAQKALDDWRQRLAFIRSSERPIHLEDGKSLPDLTIELSPFLAENHQKALAKQAHDADYLYLLEITGAAQGASAPLYEVARLWLKEQEYTYGKAHEANGDCQDAILSASDWKAVKDRTRSATLAGIMRSIFDRRNYKRERDLLAEYDHGLEAYRKTTDDLFARMTKVSHALVCIHVECNKKGVPPTYDNWKDDADKAAEYIELGERHSKRREMSSAMWCFDAAIQSDWDFARLRKYYRKRAEGHARCFGKGSASYCTVAYSDYVRASAIYKGNKLTPRINEVVKSLENAINSDWQLLPALNTLAWIHSTHPDARLRDGRLAVKQADHVCADSNWHCAGFVDTLAAAYAETGQFDRAIACGERAVLLAPAEKREAIEGTLELFRSGSPYRQL